MSAITESYIEIMNLLHSYPERIAAGDFEGVGELFAPDLDLPLEESLQRLGEMETSDAGTVNDPAVVEWLRGSGAALAIYSGFGGQIVRNEVLDAGPPLLHLHSGWLPR